MLTEYFLIKTGAKSISKYIPLRVETLAILRNISLLEVFLLIYFASFIFFKLLDSVGGHLPSLQQESQDQKEIIGLK